MSTSTSPTSAPTAPVPTAESSLRASDAEREAVAARLRQAVSDGMLSLAEADERQAMAYAARTRDELPPLTADLPEPARPERPAAPGRRGPMTVAARRWFAAHAAVVAVLVGFLVTAWALSGAPWFWPTWPLFWLGLSLLVHRRLARRT